MLNKLVRVLVLLAAFGLGSVALAANKAEKLSVEDIMSEAHNKKKGVTPKIATAVKDEKWDDAAKPANRLKELGEELSKTSVEKGSKESWKKLSEEYKTTTASVADGVKKKDKKATEDALMKLGKSCDACHEAHRD